MKFEEHSIFKDETFRSLVLTEACEIVNGTDVDPVRAKVLDSLLRCILSDVDPFWNRWRYIGEEQGWLK